MSLQRENLCAQFSRYKSTKIYTRKSQFSNNLILQNIRQSQTGRIDIVTDDIGNGIKMVLKRIKVQAVEDNSHLSANIQGQMMSCMKFKNAKNPFVVEIKDVWKTKLYYNILMDWCDSHTLQQELKSDAIANSRPELCVIYLLSILYGITACHQQGIKMIRDIKPSNIMVTHNLTQKMLKLIDFGNVATTSLATNPQGSDFYQAPEVFGINNKWLSNDCVQKYGYEANCDIWSLGVICFQLYTGFLQHRYGCITFPFVQTLQEQEQTPQSYNELLKEFYSNCVKIKDGVEQNMLILKIYKNLSKENGTRMKIYRQLIKKMLWPEPLNRLTSLGIYNLININKQALFYGIENQFAVRNFDKYFKLELQCMEKDSNQSINLQSASTESGESL